MQTGKGAIRIAVCHKCMNSVTFESHSHPTSHPKIPRRRYTRAASTHTDRTPPKDLRNFLLGTLTVEEARSRHEQGKTRVVSQGGGARGCAYVTCELERWNSSLGAWDKTCVAQLTRHTYLENAYGSATHRVLSDGAGMVDELGARARVCGRATADLISAPWHPMPRLGEFSSISS